MDATNSRYYYLFLFTLYIFLNAQFLFTNSNSEKKAERHRKNLKEIEETLKNETFNSSWGLPDSYHEYHDKINNPKMIHEAKGRFYSRAFGTIRGDWVKALPSKTLNSPANHNSSADYSWYDSIKNSEQGYLTLETQSLSPELFISKDVIFLQGYLTIYSDIAETEYTYLRVEGVHVIKNGSIYLHGYPTANNYNPGNLLKLLPTHDLFNTTLQFFSDNFSSRLEFFEAGESSFVSSDASCWVQILFQLEPFSSLVSPQEIKVLEQELRNPQGINTISPIPLKSDMMVYSPNCPEIALFGSQITGYKVEVKYQKLTHYSIIALFMGMLSCICTIRQIEYSSTPSMVSKVSWPSLGLQMVLEGYLSLAHFTGAVFFTELRTSFLAASFFFVISLSLFQMRFFQLIFRIQQPQASPDSQRNSMSILNLLFYALMLCGLPLVWQTLTSRGAWQRFLLWTSILILYSFWLPQIWRNTMRGTAKGLSIIYVLGMSLGRLFFPLYLFSCPNNVLGLKPQLNSVFVLVCYVAAQVAILFSQDRFGSRWILPFSTFSSTYNYHPRPNGGNEEAPLDPNYSDCAICMVSLSDNSSGSSSPNLSCSPKDPLLSHTPQASHHSHRPAISALNLLSASRSIMVTPCLHNFHTSCLEEWMKIKLECPVCRAPLPPV